MDNIFFSTQNYRKIYNIIENNIKKSYNINIASTPTYKKKIIDTMKYVYSNRTQFEIPNNMNSIDKSIYLSQKTIKIFMLYENDTRAVPTKNHTEFKNPINTNTFDSRIVNSPPANNNKLRRDIQSSVIPVNQLQLSERPNSILKQDNRNQIEINLKRTLNERSEIKPPPVNIDFRDESVSKFENVNIHNKYMELAELREREYEPATKKTTEFSDMTGTNNYANVDDPNNRNTFLEQPEFKIEMTPMSTKSLPENAIQTKLDLVPKPLNTDNQIADLQKIEPDNTEPDEFIETEAPNKIITTNGVFESEGFEDFPGFDSQSDLLMTPLNNSHSDISINDIIKEQEDITIDTTTISNSQKMENIIKARVELKSGHEDNIQNDKLDRIHRMLETYMTSDNRIETLETNINQMFYALKDDNEYKTETHTLHLRIDSIIDYTTSTCPSSVSCESDCEPSQCIVKGSGTIISCFWNGSKVRVKFPVIKNVISIKLKKVIAPYAEGSGCSSSSMKACDCGDGGGIIMNSPFYYLMVDELKSDIIQGHSVFGDNPLVLEETPFCKMYYDEAWPKAPHHPEYMYYSNMDGDETVFKTPKATLDIMTLSIKMPGKNCTPPQIKTCVPTYLFFEVKTVVNYSGWNTIKPTI